MIGPKNEVEVVVNDEWVTALVDSGAQISAVSMAFVKHHNLPIWQLQQLLDFEGFGGVDISYIGYTQIQLQIPGIKITIRIFWYSFKKIAVIQNKFQWSYKRCDSVSH